MVKILRYNCGTVNKRIHMLFSSQTNAILHANAIDAPVFELCYFTSQCTASYEYWVRDRDQKSEDF